MSCLFRGHDANFDNTVAIVFLEVQDVGASSCIADDPDWPLGAGTGRNPSTEMSAVLGTFLLAPANHVGAVELFVLRGVEKPVKINAVLLQPGQHA